MPATFDRSDAEYLAWIRENPEGYVINVNRVPTPEYMVLHRASCTTVTELHPPATAGGFTERDYIKVCAEGIAELSEWVKQHGSPSGSFSSQCLHCKPL